MRSKKWVVLFIIIILAFAFTDCIAQKYVVYSVVGKAYISEAGKFVPLSSRKYVTSATRLKITSESAVTVLDESKLKMFSFTRVGESNVGELVASVGKRTKNLSKQYMGYLVKQLFTSANKKMKHPDSYMQVTGTSYRADSKDSIMMARLVQIVETGTAPHGTAEQSLFSSENRIVSDYAVAMDIVDVNTGVPVKNVVKTNTACYVRVKNDTDETLYVNVLNLDKSGNKYLVLPMDEEATCANLLVPAKSTVSFKSEPFITSDVTSDDAFVLVATEMPVNFSILMSPLQKGSFGNSSVKVGVVKKNIETR